MFRNLVLNLALVSALAAPALAADTKVGTLTQVQGEVKVFRNPSKKLPAPTPGATHALFEGEYYVVTDAKVGDSVENGAIVRTTPSAKARVVYENGDQFNVGPGTAYKIAWSDRATADKGQIAKTEVNLMYGKLRGIIEKGGPRSKLQIKTRTAIMGVRGTDFFIASGGEDNGTHVTVVRGNVEVKPEPAKDAPKDAPPAKAIEIKAGMSAEVTPPVEVSKSAPAVAPAVELRKSTQEDLIGIQRTSVINKATAAATTEEAKKVEQLEKKAVETTMKDIKATDAKLYAELTKDPSKTNDAVNSKAIDKLLAVAPKAPEKRKPYKSELDDLEAGAYEKYFKNVD